MDVRDALDYIEDLYPGYDEYEVIREAIKEKDKEIERLRYNFTTMLTQIDKYMSIDDGEIQAVLLAVVRATRKKIKKKGEH